MPDRGDSSGICPKYRAMRGAVNSMAPRETDALVRAYRPAAHSLPLTGRSFPGFRALRGRYSQRNSGSEASRIPATDAKDSCRPTLAAAKGFWISSRSRAKARAVGPSPSRRARGANSSALCMITARRAEAVPPAIKA